MGLLTALGLNTSFFYIFVLFPSGCWALYALLCKPYFQAYKERLSRTEGFEEGAEETLGEVKEIKERYQSRQRYLRDQLQKTYEEIQQRGFEERSKILESAQREAKEKIEKSHKESKEALNQGRQLITSEVDGLSEEIVMKMLK